MVVGREAMQRIALHIAFSIALDRTRKKDKKCGPVSLSASVLRSFFVFRFSFFSSATVPIPAGVKKAGIPAPPARIRSTSVPWGTISKSTIPADI